LTSSISTIWAESRRFARAKFRLNYAAAAQYPGNSGTAAEPAQTAARLLGSADSYCRALDFSHNIK
jgi:hypothetical protein